MGHRTNKNIVYDLDDTLIKSFEGKESYRRFVEKNNELKDKIYSFYLYENSSTVKTFMWGIKRPHLDKLISTSFKYFNTVGVWSAGRKDYVEEIVKAIFTKRKPHFVISREFCDSVLVEPDYTVMFKPLDCIFINNPHLGMNRENTIIIDDRDDVSSRNTMNHIEIPAFSPRESELLTVGSQDNYLLDLINFIKSEQFIESDDVQLINKENIFK